MNPAGKSRRGSVLLKAGRGQPARPMVEKRSLYAYWAILMPHFRGVLLPPQNRSDESIQWTWNENGTGDTVSAAEFATIRKRLTGAQQSLADSLEDTTGLAAKAATIRATIERMDEVVRQLAALPDPALAGFVARTERGLLLHSWGLASPLPLQHLDADLVVAGRVLVADAPAPGYEVRLETAEGASVGRVVTDGQGCFEFSKVAAGSYRVRAVSRPPTVVFPEKGYAVELFGSAVTDIEIRDEDGTRSAPPPRQGASSRGRLWIFLSVAALLAVAIYWFWPGRGGPPVASSAHRPGEKTVNVAPRAVGTPPSGPGEDIGPGIARTEKKTLGGSERAQPPSRMPPSPAEVRPDPAAQIRGTDIVVARQSSGLPAQSSGTPSPAGGVPGGPSGAGASGTAGGGQAGAPATAARRRGPGGPPAAGKDAAMASVPAASPAALPMQAAAVVTPENPPPSSSPPDRKSSPANATPGPVEREKPRETPRPADAASQPVGDDAGGKAAAAGAGQGGAAAEGPGAGDADETASPAGDGPFVSDAPVPDALQDEETRKETVSPSRESGPHPAAVGEGHVHGPEVVSEPAFTVRMTFRVSPWRRLLLRDAIVPTLPTRTGRDDALKMLSGRLLEEKQAATPRTLQEGRVIVGLRLELPAGFSGRALYWKIADGGGVEPLQVSVEGNTAEIAWRDGLASGGWVLAGHDGRAVVSVSVNPQGEVSISSEIPVSSRPWVGVEWVAGEAGRFAWRAIGTVDLPASWVGNNRWADGRGHRVDLDGSTAQDETVALTLALVDEESGWALASRVEYRQEARR